MLGRQECLAIDAEIRKWFAQYGRIGLEIKIFHPPQHIECLLNRVQGRRKSSGRKGILR